MFEGRDVEKFKPEDNLTLHIDENEKPVNEGEDGVNTATALEKSFNIAEDVSDTEDFLGSEDDESNNPESIQTDPDANILNNDAMDDCIAQTIQQALSGKDNKCWNFVHNSIDVGSGG